MHALRGPVNGGAEKNKGYRQAEKVNAEFGMETSKATAVSRGDAEGAVKVEFEIKKSKKYSVFYFLLHTSHFGEGPQRQKTSHAEGGVTEVIIDPGCMN